WSTVCSSDLMIDQAIAIATLPDTILCSFGDMLRVPGTHTDLLTVKAQGGDIRMVYSPLDALKIAQAHPEQQVVFFAVGFETTAPATAMAVYQAHQLGVENFSMLVCHVLVPPAMAAILAAPNCRVQGFLAAGHVCTVMGYQAYEPIAQKYHIPIVVTGFEPIDILQGLYMCIQQLEAGTANVENQYSRSVRPQGNLSAQHLMQAVFQVVPRQWRGIGEIPHSGLGLREKYANFDAQRRFSKTVNTYSPTPDAASPCISGLILQGIKKPHECSAFGHNCTPEHPLGAPMVSSEGACAAYYRYRKIT
ncbi:MAG: hydrogenase formation protein HypD, partial [Cyanothece sp. SIO1E1]|nr:hydrogenase formation protein HypD [Cyanothece sp. SIO1E1]